MPTDRYEEPAATSPEHRPGAWLLAGAVALASVGLSLGLIAATGPTAADAPGSAAPTEPRPQPDDTAVPSPRPTPPPTAEAPAEVLTPTAAGGALADFLDEVAEVVADPADGIADLDDFATGAILAELENDQLELADNGWTRSGRESVVSLEVTATDPDATPPTAIVEACIDSKNVVLLDAAGKPIVSGMTPKQKRSINIYTLVLEGGTWLVADRTFPDEAAC